MSASQELTRLRYLAAMGVPVYVTRRALPGAAASTKFALRSTSRISMAGPASSDAPRESSPAATVASPPRRGSSPPAAQALRESLRKDAGQHAAGRGAFSAKPRAAATDHSDSALPIATNTRFRLAAMICAGRLWLEALGEEALASEQLQLVTALGRALTHPDISDDAVAVTEFCWPLHDNAQLGLGAEAAAATLQGFLDRQIEENACVELICLGASSKALLADLKVPCARRFAPSTRDVLQAPLLKRDLWTALQA